MDSNSNDLDTTQDRTQGDASASEVETPDTDSDDDDRDEAVISADDTGLVSQQRFITEEEIEHPEEMGTP